MLQQSKCCVTTTTPMPSTDYVLKALNIVYLNNDCAQSLTLRRAIKRAFQIDPSHYRPFTTVKVQKSESCSTFQPCSSYNGPNFSPPFSLKES